MKSLLYLRVLFLMIFGLFMAENVYATHIRAGEITARRIDQQNLEYEITLWGYADTDSEVIFGSNGTLDFGDGTSLLLNNTGDPNSPTYIPRTRISEDTWLYVFKVKHTFPSARTYRVTFREFYRNEGILNMDNSVNMPFYIETVIVIDPFLGVNNTPQLLVPPVDKAAVGKVYIHNPGAYDADGDSLSYRLVVVRQDNNTPVANYRYPPNTFPEGDPRNGTSLTGGEPTLTLNPITGDLVWNTPGTKGEYNVAFYVEEWRKIRGKYYLLGHVTRDMQILVEDSDNEPPVIEIPEDICVVAGENIMEKIGITDPDNDKIQFSYFGGPFTLGAEMSKDGRKLVNRPDSLRFDTPVELGFNWQTECSDVRQQPYQVIFRATDLRGGSAGLTDIKTWNIRVVAPAPALESVSAVDSRSIQVNFNRSTYACQQQASAVQVWRREGRVDIPIDTCITGMPPGYGYELIDVRNLGSFPFVDNSPELKPGATYCYRIVMAFPEPSGGESLVSEELCVTLPAKMPLMTNVSILETDEANGEILVKWVPGPDLADNEVTKPYSYDLYRSEGFTGGPYTLIASDIPAEEYVDSAPGLNTKDQVYNYYVMLKNASGVEFDSSSTASSVRLTPVPGTNSITLQWEASVPWSNRVQDYPIHQVYRNRVLPDFPDSLVQIAAVDVVQQGFTYVDDGTDAGGGPLQDEIEYCYYVITAGSYGNPEVPEPLFNNSQVVCSFTRDEVPPCPPLSFELAGMPSCEEIIREKDCDDDSFDNVLVWTSNTDNEDCFLDLSHWLVYYSPNGQDYEVVGQVSTSTSPGNWQFVHTLTGTMAGFYYVQAVDRSGNLSEPSEIIIRDNCPNYWLPNVITRNGDNRNDELRPPRQSDFNLDGNSNITLEEFRSRCPRFVENVVFKVYNRWGKLVYDYNSASAPEKDIYINWNARTNNGEPVTNGTYYYTVEVTYNVLDPARRQQTLKGWVYVTDGKTSPGDTQ